MLPVLLQTLPFFALIGLGYSAGRTGFFTDEATAWLTKFVFYFALSAMIFRFAANLSLGEVLTREFVLAYLSATVVVYLFMVAVSLIRGRGLEEAAVEAQCGVIGNVGFLGLPMLAMLLGEAAIGPVMVVLAIDVTVFGSLIVILITASAGRAGVGRHPVVRGQGASEEPDDHVAGCGVRCGRRWPCRSRGRSPSS
jgi:malonate transporter and related proteins